MKNKLVLAFFLLAIVLGITAFALYLKEKEVPLTHINNTQENSVVEYENISYGFNFLLPTSWQGYSIVNNTWKGTPLSSEPAPNGIKLLIRNPKWTEAAPYEDLPILIFTISEWNSYLAENFAISAAPIQARELARNDTYVFALPPRWDFDYSINYKEAQDIISGNPIRTFNLGSSTAVSQGKINVNKVCEDSTSYMRFIDKKSADKFIADCIDGKHPEVIEKYTSGLQVDDNVKI